MKQNSNKIVGDGHVFELARNCLLFRDFTGEQLDLVLQTIHVIQLDEGDRLFSQEQVAHHFFQLIDGQIKLTRLSGAGREKVIDIISPSQTFAEAVMFLKSHHYPVNAEAVVHSTVVQYDAQQYLNVLRSSGDACMALLGRMSQRLHGQVQEIDRLTLHSATSRVISYLLDQVPIDNAAKTEIRLHVPKHVIASRLSIKPETLSRIFARLTINNLIQVEDNHIVLNDVGKVRLYMLESDL